MKTPFIQITIEELAHRGEKVRQLLQPIAKISGGPAWQPKATISEFIIGTHDGSPIRSGYRDWRFATITDPFQGMYFELWKRYDNKFWHLDRAYLSLYYIDRGTRSETEFLSLHCDPNEPDEAAHAIYKKGPHLHIQAAAKPIPHAHLALNVEHLQQVLGSVDSLSEAMASAIRMLRDEILDAIEIDRV